MQLISIVPWYLGLAAFKLMHLYLIFPDLFAKDSF